MGIPRPCPSAAAAAGPSSFLGTPDTLGNGFHYVVAVFRGLLREVGGREGTPVPAPPLSDSKEPRVSELSCVFQRMVEERERQREQREDSEVWAQLFASFEGVRNSNDWQRRELPPGLGPTPATPSAWREEEKEEGNRVSSQPSSRCLHCRRCPSCPRCPGGGDIKAHMSQQDQSQCM